MPLLLMLRLMPRGVPSSIHVDTSTSASAALAVQALTMSPWMGEV